MNEPFPAGFFDRADDSGDADFYSWPRLVTHIDDGAIAAVGTLYAELGLDGDVLDIMSSWVSHFQQAPAHLTVLGMNLAELAANRAGEDPRRPRSQRPTPLPFADASFDAVVCCVSVDYLTRPVEVFRDVARVLRPGGPFVCTFSNRCFPTKAIRGWLYTSDEQHCEIVAEYFRRSGAFRGARHRPPDAPGPSRRPSLRGLGSIGRLPSSDEGLPARPACRRGRGGRESRGQSAGQRPGPANERRLARAPGTRLPVISVLVVGLGETGVRTGAPVARHARCRPGLRRRAVPQSRTRSVAEALHDGAEAWTLSDDAMFPPEIDAIASAVPASADATLAQAAVERGIPFASVADHDAAISALLALDEPARARGTTVLAGCGLAPGLADVLVRHAGGVLDSVDEVHVARFGVGGPACASLAAPHATGTEPRVARASGGSRSSPGRGIDLVPRSGGCTGVRVGCHRRRVARGRDPWGRASDGSPGRSGPSPVRASRPPRSRGRLRRGARGGVGMAWPGTGDGGVRRHRADRGGGGHGPRCRHGVARGCASRGG